jgi:NADPH-dependent 2,4-dienoyl-CoA reductase/sulfur reductase-like enzyme
MSNKIGPALAKIRNHTGGNMNYPDTTHNSTHHNSPECKRILIVGAGFAGMYAALSAARLCDEQGVTPDTSRLPSLRKSAPPVKV